MSCGSKLTFESVVFKIGCQDAHWNDKNKCKITFTSHRSVMPLETGHLLNPTLTIFTHIIILTGKNYFKLTDLYQLPINYFR